MRETTYKDTRNNVLRQTRLIEDMVRKKEELEKSLLGESEKLSDILLDAVDRGEIHIVDAYGYWAQNNEHLPVDRYIDSEFLDRQYWRNSHIERRQRVLYCNWLELAAEPFPPPIAESKWQEQLENVYGLERFSWAASKDGGLNYEGIFAMMHRLIANGQKGFICDW